MTTRTPKTVYQCDQNGYYVGTTQADPCPIDENVWLLPGGAVEKAPPALADGQRAKWTGKAWKVEDIPAPAAPASSTEAEAPAARDPLDVLAELRWLTETAGFMVDGVKVKMDRDSRMLLAEMHEAASQHPYNVFAYKSPDGFIQLKANQVKRLHAAVCDMVQACFLEEARIADLIGEGNIRTEADVIAAWKPGVHLE